MKIYWSFYFLIFSFSVFFVSFGKNVRFMVFILWMYVSLCWLFLCMLVLWSWRDLWVDKVTDIIIIITIAVRCNCHKMHKCKCTFLLLENYFQYNFVIKSGIWSFCSTVLFNFINKIVINLWTCIFESNCLVNFVCGFYLDIEVTDWQNKFHFLIH